MPKKSVATEAKAAASTHPARESAIDGAMAVHRKRRSSSNAAVKARTQETPARKFSPDLPESLRALAVDDRVNVRRDGAPDPNGKAVVY